MKLLPTISHFSSFDHITSLCFCTAIGVCHCAWNLAIFSETCHGWHINNRSYPISLNFCWLNRKSCLSSDAVPAASYFLGSLPVHRVEKILQIPAQFVMVAFMCASINHAFRWDYRPLSRVEIPVYSGWVPNYMW